MNILFYDTETTGLPDWFSPSEAAQQPHIVQLAAAIVDSETRRIEASVNLIVRPDGWTIPDPVGTLNARLFQITTEQAAKTGIPEADALQIFLAMWRVCELRVAHNERFDARIVRIATKRYCGMEAQEAWKAGYQFCTMVASTDLCRIPKASGRGGWKFPKLSEAYTHFTGEEFVDAHNAWEDLTAAQAVYWGILDAQSKILKEDLSTQNMYFSQRVPVVGSKIPDVYRKDPLPEQE